MYTVKSNETLQASLQQVLALLETVRVLDDLAHRQVGPQREVVEELTRRQNLAALHNRLRSLHPADLGFILGALPVRERLLAWTQVPDRLAAESLIEVGPEVRTTLLDGTDRPRLLGVLRHLDADDLAYLAEDLPPDLLAQAAEPLPERDRSWLKATFRAGSVGQLMTQEAVTVREERTSGEAIAELRARGELPPQTDAIFVLDARHVLRGVLPLPSLLTAAAEVPVSRTCAAPAVAFLPDDPAREAAQAFERYDLVSAPVVDERGKLVGRLTVDAVMDFRRQEAELKALQRAGLRGEEDLFAPAWASARNRALWLGINLATAFLASRVIGLFVDTISHVVALATLMPVVASVGGNTGNQTVALLVRALAMGQISPGNVRHLFRKELSVALLNGVAWGTVMGLFAYALYRSLPLGGVMAAAIVLNLLVAAVVGLAVPLLLGRLGRDPAQGSSVLLTFSTDGMGFLIFLGLAQVFLR